MLLARRLLTLSTKALAEWTGSESDAWACWPYLVETACNCKERLARRQSASTLQLNLHSSFFFEYVLGDLFGPIQVYLFSAISFAMPQFMAEIALSLHIRVIYLGLIHMRLRGRIGYIM